MNRPRVPLGLEATRATLNRAVCLQIGRALGEARRNQDLSIQAVGSRLLLSTTQVAALEDVNPDTFYSAEFYASALKKYTALLGVDSDQLDRILVGPARADTVTTASVKRKRRLPEAPLIPVRPRKAAIAAAAVIVTVLVSWPLVTSFRSAPTRAPIVSTMRPSDVGLIQTPSTEVSPAVTNPATTPEVVATLDVGSPEPTPAMAESTSAAHDIFGRVRVDAPTWIFVRYANNSTSERGLAAGDEFVLRQRPTYLAVGSAEGTHVEIAGRAIDSAAFVNNGQLRITSSSLTRLRNDP